MAGATSAVNREECPVGAWSAIADGAAASGIAAAGAARAAAGVLAAGPVQIDVWV